MTLAQFLLDRFLPTIKSDVSRRTFIRYEQIVTAHLVPTLGAIPLSKLAVPHVESAKAKWLTEGCVRNDKRKGTPLAPRTTLHHLRVLHHGLELAVQWGLITRNVASLVRAPRLTRATARALNVEEAAKLLETARGTPMFAPIAVALTTGVRRGELLAITWRDLDEREATLRIESSIEQTRGQLAFKPPKNGRSRIIKLGAYTLSILQGHRQAQHAQIFRRRQLGLPYKHNNLVFACEDGGIWPPATFGWRFGTIVKRAVIGAFRLHDLRHSSASLLISKGVDIKRVSERLGHSGIAITADTYGHLFADGQAAAAEAIDEVLSGVLRAQ